MRKQLDGRQLEVSNVDLVLSQSNLELLPHDDITNAAFTVGGKRVRKTNETTPPRVSVIDLINRNADAQQHLPKNHIARLFGEAVEAGSKYTANKSTLQIESGSLMGFDGPGVYIIHYGEKLIYDQTAVPQTHKLYCLAMPTKNSGYDRCKEHRQLTGPTTRVIDFMPPPHYV